MHIFVHLRTLLAVCEDEQTRKEKVTKKWYNFNEFSEWVFVYKCVEEHGFRVNLESESFRWCVLKDAK